MSKYIEREDAKEITKDKIKPLEVVTVPMQWYGRDSHIMWNKINEIIEFINNNKTEIDNIINDQPTADVVEVVRCKDCKYHEKDETGVWCSRVFNSHKTVEDNFCKFGAKMDKE